MNATDGRVDETSTEPPLEDVADVIVALVPKVPALLSLISSFILIRECAADLKFSKIRTYGRSNGGVSSPPLVRTLLAMGVADLFFSFPWFMTTWMVPSSIDGDWLMNVGNAATCTLQGTIATFGIVSVPLFNVMFTFFSLLMVRYEWRDYHLAKLEPWLHAILWSMAAAIAVFPIPLKMYNFTDSICWIAAYPYDCKNSSYGEEATCTHGDNAWIYAIVFTVFPAWLCFVISVVLMTMIYHTVRNVEDRVSVYTTRSRATRSKTSAASSVARQPIEQSETGGSNGMVDTGLELDTPAINRAKSEAVAWRALGIAFGFLLTYLLDLVVVILWNYFSIYHPVLSVFAYSLYPLQGFLNLMVFIRKQDSMRTPEGRFVAWLFWRLGSCLQCNSAEEERSPT